MPRRTRADAPPDSPFTPRPGGRAGGRPALAPERRRTQTIGVRVSAAEAAQLAALAARVGLKPGSFLRVAALGTVPRSVPAVNREQWVELARTASNLNQLTRALQRGVPVTVSGQVPEALRVQLYANRQALLGKQPDGREMPSAEADAE